MRAIRSAATVIVGCVIAARIVACSSFSEAPAEAVPEAGDSSTDTSAGDGAVDAYVSADAAGCTIVLKDDFGRNDVLAGPWDSTNQTGGTLMTSTGNPFDKDAGARSLLATIPNDAGPAVAYLYKGLGTAKVVRLSFALRADLTAGRMLYVNTLEMNKANERLLFIVRPGDVSLEESVLDAGTSGKAGSTFYALGNDTTEWHQYELTVALDAPARVYVTRDGVKVLDQPLKASFRPGPAFVKGGISYVVNGETATASFDDFVICTLPP